jgi:hypothetical protein
MSYNVALKESIISIGKSVINPIVSINIALFPEGNVMYLETVLRV